MNEKPGKRVFSLVDMDLSRVYGGISLGTIHSQKFYAIRADSPDIKFPFPAGAFTAFIELTAPAEKAQLHRYAEAIANHGCVQAVCRGENSDILADIFCKMAEDGSLDRDSIPFTCMYIGDEEPLAESIEYFITPSDLASTGVFVVIGGSEGFADAVTNFIQAAGSICEDMGEPEYIDDKTVLFSRD